MTIKSAALAVGLALGASQAMAQPLWYDGGRSAIPAREIAAIVRSNGLTPVTPPARVGPNYVVHAIDRNGETMRVVIDADFGDIVRIRPLGPRTAGPGPWNRWGGPRPYRYYGDLSDELGVRHWWNTTPPRPRRNVPVARAPIGPDDGPPAPRPRIDPPVVTGAPADPADAPPPVVGATSAPDRLPPPPPVNTARTGPEGPPPSTAALRAGEPRMNWPSASVPQGAQAAKPRTAPLPKPRPSAEQMAAKPGEAAPAESRPATQPRVVLPGGPAANTEKAAEVTGAVPSPAAAAPTASPQAAPAPAAKSQAGAAFERDPTNAADADARVGAALEA